MLNGMAAARKYMKGSAAMKACSACSCGPTSFFVRRHLVESSESEINVASFYQGVVDSHVKTLVVPYQGA